MSISGEKFIEMFRQAGDVMGWNLKSERLLAIHSRCMYSNPTDLEYALRMMEDEDRFKTNRFLVLINDARATREDALAQKKLDAEDREAKAFLSKELKDSKPCSLRPDGCRQCQKKYCADMSRDALKFTRMLFCKDTDLKEVHWTLNDKYPGAYMTDEEKYAEEKNYA
jgi:hypothetical protein